MRGNYKEVCEYSEPGMVRGHLGGWLPYPLFQESVYHIIVVGIPWYSQSCHLLDGRALLDGHLGGDVCGNHECLMQYW